MELSITKQKRKAIKELDTLLKPMHSRIWTLILSNKLPRGKRAAITRHLKAFIKSVDEIEGSVELDDGNLV